MVDLFYSSLGQTGDHFCETECRSAYHTQNRPGLVRLGGLTTLCIVCCWQCVSNSAFQDGELKFTGQVIHYSHATEQY